MKDFQIVDCWKIKNLLMENLMVDHVAIYLNFLIPTITFIGWFQYHQK